MSSGIGLITSSLWPPQSFLLAGGEESHLWYSTLSRLTSITRHHGFIDVLDETLPTFGAWIWQDPTTGIIWGRTSDTAGNSTTASGYQLVINTWYIEKIVFNSDASRVDFYCYAEDGTELWHDNLTTHIPVAVGEETGHGFIAVNSIEEDLALFLIDKMSVLIPDRRPAL